MANDIIDINVYETTETVSITVQPNLTTINVNSVTSVSPVTSVNGQIGDVVIPTSDNNFTTVLKNKLDGIQAGAEVNVNADWNATSGDAQILNKPTIPAAVTKTSDLTNDGANGVNPFITLEDIPAGGLTSVGLTMPTAFSVANSPLTSDGTIAVTASGTSAQYIRGDGQLATLPSGGGGGASVFYYLNGSIAASVATYKQLSNTAVIGAGTDFAITGNGLITQFLTDVGNPNRLQIPSGAWNFEMFFSMSSSGGTPKFYVELLKYNGATFTTIANNSAAPETISGGTNIDLYLSSLAVPETTLLLTDRLAIRVYIVNSTGGRTATLHTEDNHLCQITTTFASGISAINGLNSNNQYLSVGTSGTDFNINSASETHTFNLPTASATNRGALSTTDWSAFNAKQNALTNPITGTGTIGTIPKFNGSTTSLADSTIIQLANGDITINGLRLGLGLASVAQNTVFGYQSGNAITTGNFNTLMGYQAGTLLTEGQENTFLGRYAGTAATTAAQNVAIGQGAGIALSTGAGNNVLVGNGSGNKIKTGQYNSAIGNSALQGVITGSQNTAIGFGALQSTTSNYNTALGYNSGSKITGGQQQVTIGYESLGYNTTGDYNISIGSQAGRSTSVGNLISSSSSIFIGYLTKALANGQTNQIVIGDSAIGLGSNSVVLGNDSITKTILKGNVGIGTTAPVASAKVQIDSTTQGFLPPRMTNAQRIAIATPAVGLCVYCTDVVEGLYINKSTGWTYIG
jgi:hypothetical protein